MAPAGMRVYGEICAWTLARAHARSGDRVAIASYVGTSRRLDDALVEFGHRYADQNRLDHAALVTAIAEGQVEAISGV
jgi:predicted alpha/beta hydrolase